MKQDQHQAICRVWQAGLLLEFRIEESAVERRILNSDQTSIDPLVSDWKPVSVSYLEAMRVQSPELGSWLVENRLSL